MWTWRWRLIKEEVVVEELKVEAEVDMYVDEEEDMQEEVKVVVKGSIRLGGANEKLFVCELPYEITFSIACHSCRQ